MIKIDPEFSNIIPPLTTEEYTALENSIRNEGCRDALVVWNDILIDGHNRYNICQRYEIKFKTIAKNFADRDEAKIWIITNQLARRNLPVFVSIELALQLKPLIEKKAKENLSQGGGDRKSEEYKSGSQNSAKAIASIDTREEVAKIAGTSHDTVTKAEKIIDKAPEEVKKKLRNSETSINAEYKKIRKDEKKAKEKEMKAQIEMIIPSGKYHTIVIDPPWPIQKVIRDVRPNQYEMDYPTMTLEEINSFDVPSLALDNCHLFCWTTEKFLPETFKIIEAWGFRYIFTMVWHKNGGFQPFGLPQYNCEFIIYGRKGSIDFVDTKNFNTCFNGERREHSRKPDKFYDLIKRVTQEPRIDIFSREQREGFSQYGNETGKF